MCGRSRRRRRGVAPRVFVADDQGDAGEGTIGIFNRSYYEEVLVVRVHPQILETQKLPKRLVTKHIWQERLKTSTTSSATRHGWIAVVNSFYIFPRKSRSAGSGTAGDSGKELEVFFSDVKERGFWDAYQDAYEETIRHTASEFAPGMLCRRINKWFTRLVFHTRWWRRCRG